MESLVIGTFGEKELNTVLNCVLRKRWFDEQTVIPVQEDSLLCYFMTITMSHLNTTKSEVIFDTKMFRINLVKVKITKYIVLH